MCKLKSILPITLLGFCAAALSAAESMPSINAFNGGNNNPDFFLWWTSPWDSAITTGDGNKKGLSSDGYTEHEDIGFIIHSVSDPGKHFTRRFFESSPSPVGRGHG